MKHVIKIYPIYFQQVIDGLKKAELRNNDRNYQAGDIVEMLEYCPEKNDITWRNVMIEITVVNDVSQFVNTENIVMFSFILL